MTPSRGNAEELEQVRNCYEKVTAQRTNQFSKFRLMSYSILLTLPISFYSIAPAMFVYPDLSSENTSSSKFFCSGS